MTQLSAIQWGLSAVMFTAVLHLIWVDLKSLRIPDMDSLLIAASGAAYHLIVGNEALISSLLTGISVTTLLYVARSAHMAVAGKVGLGLGDVKLIGAASLWISPWNLPLFMLLASTGALAYALTCSGVQRGDWRTRRIPFGPFLGVALIVIWQIETLFHFELI